MRAQTLALVLLVAPAALSQDAPAGYVPESPDAVFQAEPDGWVREACNSPCTGAACDAASAPPVLPPGMLGDWCGARTHLAESGVNFRVIGSQFYQGVTRGGFRRDWEYGGKVDYIGVFDGGKLGIQEGLQVLLHAETRFGQDVNREAAGLAPANVNMLMPNEDQITAITQLAVVQVLDEEGWAVTFGKYNSLDLFDMLHHNGRGIDGFMNSAMLLPLGAGRTVPLSFLGAGAMKFNEQQEIDGGLLVIDTNDVATTVGIDDLYDSGASVIGFWRFRGDLGGREGDLLLGGLWSSRQYRSTDRTSFFFQPETGLVGNEESGSWFLFADAHQMLWEGGCDDARRVEALSMWSLTDGEANPLDWTMNVGVTAHGLIRSRPADVVGVGYFYTGLAAGFATPIIPRRPSLNDVQGVELYYKMAVTPWFQLTADLQFLEPAVAAAETAVVPGLRGVLEF